MVRQIRRKNLTDSEDELCSVPQSTPSESNTSFKVTSPNFFQPKNLPPETGGKSVPICRFKDLSFDDLSTELPKPHSSSENIAYEELQKYTTFEEEADEEIDELAEKKIELMRLKTKLGKDLEDEPQLNDSKSNSNTPSIDFTEEADALWEAEILKKGNYKNSAENLLLSNLQKTDDEKDFSMPLESPENIVLDLENKIKNTESKIEAFTADDGLIIRLDSQILAEEAKTSTLNETARYEKTKIDFYTKMQQHYEAFAAYLNLFITKYDLDAHENKILDLIEESRVERLPPISYEAQALECVNICSFLSPFIQWYESYKKDFDVAFILESIKLLLDHYFFRIILFGSEMSFERIIIHLNSLKKEIPVDWHDAVLFGNESFWSKWLHRLSLNLQFPDEILNNYVNADTSLVDVLQFVRKTIAHS